MTALFAIALILLGATLSLVTYAQILYLEALRLRPRERPALELFKTDIQPRLGLESDQGILAFSLIKHTISVALGAFFPLLRIAFGGFGFRQVLEGFAGAWLTMLAATYVVPQVLYRASSGRWVLPLIPVLRILAALTRPLVSIFQVIQSFVQIREPVSEKSEEPSPAENVEALIDAGTEEGLIEESDRELIQSVVAFGDKTVREVMTPRPNIVAIAADQSLENLRELVINEQYSRIPVYEDSIDRIIGFVHVRDMFELDENERKDRKVRDLVRPVRFIPETKPVNGLLREMQQDRAHMAIVVDEYGNTAGLVTLEDLVEEVFGEIRDEHEPGLDITPDANGGYIVSGNFGLDRLEELIPFRPEEDLESTTVGGLMMEWLGRIPRPGESVERDGVRIEVLSSNELRVEQVRVSKAHNSFHA